MLISVLTPVYNRKDIIKSLFQSLLSQTDQRFEWIIVDDGSVDRLEDDIEGFRQLAGFRIQYIRQKNQGKHAAVNRGVAEAQSDWIFIVDSDDTLVTDAIAVVSQQIEKSDDSIKGLVYLRGMTRGYSDQPVPTGNFAQDCCELNSCKFVAVKGDKAIIVRKAYMLAHPFPQFSGERFVTESYMWNRIFDNGGLLGFNRIIYLGEYLSGGLTNNYFKLLQANPQGVLAFITSNLQLKTIDANIYKQSAYHFCPIFSFKNLRKIFGATSPGRFISFSLMTLMMFVKLKMEKKL
ncbi:glycosyltransferase family A protein [Winslowiella iniecta]|uniref:Glycosyltransferase 2-like domain-containing protein n=1 Tax=Winslowiella iniecta TaxID=1560201 RepID=A0A0L7TA90_9GAMM|nr:glycosyltransferase family A protein [Winslowiella iniecta]KOC89209.1 hypothetical protein NG43_19045 [Winslowiella iniecta]KOC92131.1 hypothetical protein NG42_02700 [Winslowiella iniecta]